MKAKHYRNLLARAFTLGVVSVGWHLLAATENSPSIWLEGEKPARINVAPKEEGVGNPQFLSENQWLKVLIEADKVEREAPAEGVLIGYTLRAVQAGEHELWARIGYEFVRSPFDWRLDDGDWVRVAPDELTTDLRELSFWTEVAWLKLGRQALSAGEHELEFRLPQTKDANNKTRRILFALDALCLHPGSFHPNGKFKPGQEWRDARDLEAAENVFEFPEKTDDIHAALSLEGLWEVCRHDEHLPGEVAAPIRDFPAEPHWLGIPVPSDKNLSRPDLVFAHRLWYRTRVALPASRAGQSFYLVFPQNNLNTTVYVNGRYCGFDKNPFARVQIDISPAVKPGLNEIRVGIRDAWYGYSANTNNPLKLRRKFNLPKSFLSEGFQDLAYPIWDHPQSGILVTPQLVAAGKVYVSDVFVKPSVAKQELAAEVALLNPNQAEALGEIRCEVATLEGEVVKRFAPRNFVLPAGEAQTVELAVSWNDPKLWWPDEPRLYLLRATLLHGGEVIDIRHTRFGFREWSARGKDFLLNGIPFHGWADCFRAPTPGAWLKFYRDQNQTVMRFWGTSWMGLPPEEALSFMDENGVVCRRSGMLDGQRIGNMAIENDPELRELYGSEIKMELMHHWRDQLIAQVRGERNHPSVMLWSLENEWLYINCINLYGGKMDEFEREVVRVSDAVREVDPTHLTMVDGGGATKSNGLPVHGDHYVWDRAITKYPGLAYEANPTGGGRGRWEWDQQRPRFLGEDYFIAGHHPELAYLGGETVFTGKAGSLPAAGLMARILTEGYRWAGFGAFHFWMGQDDTDRSHYRSFAPRAVFCRQWDWTFAGGERVKRTFGIFNDTRWAEPITFAWALLLDGRRAAGSSTEHAVAPGTNEKLDLLLPMPEVTKRAEAQLVLTLTVGGQEVFRDTKEVSLLPNLGGALAESLVQAGSPGLAVFDPAGSVGDWLARNKVPFVPIREPQSIPDTARILLVGPDALSERASSASTLAALAVDGRRVIVLEQRHPLRYQGLPCDMSAAENEGRVAFAEDLGHPVLRGLEQKDFFTWPGDGIVYRHAYMKPARGARSLVQCDDRLQHSALVEVPVGPGLMLLSQLPIAQSLGRSVVAQHLLANLLAYAARYQLEFRPVASVVTDPLLAQALNAIGLKHTPSPDILAALPAEGKQTALISATPANLRVLASHLDRVAQFTRAGGWILLHGLTPEGLDDYNRIVGVDHMIRPFRRERVTFSPVKNRLTAGLTLGDVALYSSEKIFPWQSGTYVADDTFTYVVDYDEVAPFARFPSDYFHNMVNGMVSADAWKYIFSFELARGDRPQWEMVFPKEQEFDELTWIGNGFYHLVTRLELAFDGKDPIAFDTQPNTEPQTFAIDPPRRGKVVRWRIADWQVTPNKNDVVGVDNIYLRAKRSASFYERVKPMLNVGGLMEYPRGEGGLILCNVQIKESESPPVNGLKKQNILAALLRNLKAPFAGGKTVIAGANLKYAPVDLSGFANAFRDEKGWFGDKKFTFADLPAGRQTLAGVPFEIYQFETSPVPTVLMLGGDRLKLPNEIRGIPVGRRADALFFLHTMRLDRRMNSNDQKKGSRYETLRYVVTYADGQSEVVPVYAEVDIHDYRQKLLQAISGAQIAWSKPYEGTEYSAVAYAKQWNNPRPEVEIKSIDMLPGEQPRGIPVLLAVTAASAE